MLKNGGRKQGGQGNPAYEWKWHPKAHFYCSRSFNNSYTFTVQQGSLVHRSAWSKLYEAQQYYFSSEKHMGYGNIVYHNYSLVIEEGHRHPLAPSHVGLHSEVLLEKYQCRMSLCNQFILSSHNLNASPNVAPPCIIFLISSKNMSLCIGVTSLAAECWTQVRTGKQQRTRSKKWGDPDRPGWPQLWLWGMSNGVLSLF